MPMRNKTAKQHNFATVPRADIPRSKFMMRQTRKQAFDASELIPIMCEEVLPGDTWTHKESLLARLATPIAPLIDDLDLETFYFFVPNRILWDGWEDFITGSDTALTVPKITTRNPGVDTSLNPNSVLDHFGLLPGAYADSELMVNVLPIWAYFTIWNEWFRDQNLQEPWVWSDTWTVGYTDQIHLETTTATTWDQMPLRINKRHDVFTSSLPFAQKGNPVSIALTGNLPVTTAAADTVTTSSNYLRMRNTNGDAYPPVASLLAIEGGNGQVTTGSATGEAVDDSDGMFPANLEVDLSNVNLTTINAIRLAFQTQKLLERDARGGTRLVETLLAHFGVRAPDFRLNRPEYIGGSKIAITVNPIAQTANYTAEPGAVESAVGNLGAEMHASGSTRTFNYAATEHGYIIGVCACRATPTYQQGTRKHWRRETRLDYYWPVFAMIGEQAVDTEEIYQQFTGAPTNATWGYQEAWYEYRYTPNEITGVLRSTASQPLDWWHLSEEFGSEPALNAAFITDKTQETLARCLATAPSEQWSAQIIMDVLHESVVARMMPTYSVPGLIDHF